MRSASMSLVLTALACAACGSSGAGSPAATGSGDDAGPMSDRDGASGSAGDDDATTSSTPPSTLPDGGTVTSSPPPALNIDVSETSVSGMSSGGYMAVQWGVAFSSIVKGIGVFAGGPFDCAQGSITTAETQCSASASSAPDVTPLVAATKSLATAGKIDPTSNLAAMRVFIFGGADDVVVNPLVVDATQSYFAAFLPTSAIQYESRHASTGHTMPTLAYGGSCDSSLSPWIGKCSYDGAGTALAQIYGTLNAASTAPTGSIATLAQADFVTDPASHSLGATAYVYVPASCASGEKCRVHVAFHGCEMNADGAEGSAFYEHAGYNAWADTNHLVVLYPQTTTSSANSDACWDWWGYDSADYDTQSAPQMAMVRAMITALATGVDGGLGDAGGD